MADVKITQKTIQTTHQPLVKGGPQKPVSLSGGFDKVNFGKLNSSQTADTSRPGTVGLTPPEDGTTPAFASDGAAAMGSAVSLDDGGRPVVNLVTIANSQAEQYAALDDNLAAIGEGSITPEKKQELDRLRQDFNERVAKLSDEDRAKAYGEIAATFETAMDDAFGKANLDIKTNGMERFFKFDPSVPVEENFLAKLGSYIGLMRGEKDASFGPRCTLMLNKFINMTGDLNSSLAQPKGAAVASAQKAFGAATPAPTTGRTGGGSGPALF